MGFFNNNQMTQVALVGGTAKKEEEKEKEKKKNTTPAAVTGAVDSFLAAMNNMSNGTGRTTSLGGAGTTGDANTNAYLNAIQNMTGQTEERSVISGKTWPDGVTVSGTTPETTTPVASTPSVSEPASGNGAQSVISDKTWPVGVTVSGTTPEPITPVVTNTPSTSETVPGDEKEGSASESKENSSGAGTGSGSAEKVTVPKVQVSMDGAMDYGSYLRNYGSDTNRNYAESVRSANDDYYRALMTYGKNAEALAGNGLTGAGVSDYGSAAAYAARQGAVATAGAAKQEADAENARAYSDYLQNFRAQQEAATKEKNAGRTNAFNSIISQGITDAEVAKTLLRQTGYFSEEEIESLGGQAAAYAALQVQNAKDEEAAAQDASNNAAKTNIYNSLLQQGITDANVIASQLRMSGLFSEEEVAAYSNEIAKATLAQKAEADSAVDSANAQTAQEAYNSALANGSSPSEAKEYIKSQYGEDVAEQVASVAGAMVAASFEDSLKAAERSSSYTPFAEDNVLSKTVLDQQLATGMISQEQYDGYLGRVQALNEKWIMNLQALARNEYRADDAAAMLGITLGEDADEIDYMDASIKAARDAVVKLYESGAISSEIANRYFAKDFDAEKEAIAENKNKNGIRDVCDTILSYKSLGEQVESDIYEELLTQFLREVDIERGKLFGESGYEVKWNGKQIIVHDFEIDQMKKLLEKGKWNGDQKEILPTTWTGLLGEVTFTYNQFAVLVDVIDAWENSRAGKE